MHNIICFCFALEITSNIEVRTDSRGFCLNVAELDAFFPKQLHNISNTISSKGEVFFFNKDKTDKNEWILVPDTANFCFFN